MSRRVKPHKVRGRELEEVREKDPEGRIVYHHRTVDTLGKMLRAGTIDQAMHDAGQDFQAAFIIAQLDTLRALPILRVPGTGREPELNERQLRARRRVHEAMHALGGISSPAGSCVWHVVGLQRSVREWALRQGWGGRSVRQERAQGILVAALGMLAAHSKYGEVKPPISRRRATLDDRFWKSEMAAAIAARDPWATFRLSASCEKKLAAVRRRRSHVHLYRMLHTYSKRAGGPGVRFWACKLAHRRFPQGPPRLACARPKGLR